MHYKAMGDLTHTGSLTDRIHQFLVSEYGSFYEAMRDLRNSSASFIALRYGVLTKQPAYSLDFINEYYRAAGVKSNLNPAVTHSRAGQATMTDSDGEIKWAPHNLLPRSEELNLWSQANAGSVVVDNAVAPDGTTTAATLTISSTNFHRYILSSVTYTAGDKLTFSFWVRSDTVTTLPFGINGGANGDNNAIFSDVAVTSTWQLVEFEFTVLGSDSSLYYLIGKQTSNQPVNCQLGDVEIWHPHAYRSDLGGMANNSETGDSYVPTTSSPVYLPRVGHHIYNGNAWVNEGILHESEARTNLLTYSDDFSNWIKTRLSLGTEDSLGYTPIEASAAGTSTRYLLRDSSVISGATYTFSFDVKARENTFVQIATSTGFASGPYVNFNLSTGEIGGSSGSLNPTITNIGPDEYRVSATAPATSSTSGARFVVAIVGSTDAGRFATYSATQGDGILIRYAQLEAGSTPSSYIPTSGAAATRAAETLTVPAANLPWPTPVEVTGTELVTNGTFATDINGWTDISTGTGTFSWDSSGSALLSYNGSGNEGRMSQAVPAITGKVYTLKFTNTGSGNAFLSGTAGITSSTINAGQTHEQTVVCVGSAIIIRIYAFTGTGTTIDNISVKEINPLSVSIQMDGRMTYADTGTYKESQYYRWLSDSNNFIQGYISTVGGDTGEPVWAVKALGAAGDYATGTSTYYSPDINVPFNRSSRYGSTFINGAVDGTALTANTTPVALPDLSTTDLELGYDFMGTIGKFRVWSDDLTDTGIATASAPSTEPSLQLTFDGSSTSSFKVLDWSE